MTFQMSSDQSTSKSSLETSKSSTKSKTFENYEKIRTVGKGAFGTAILYKRLSDSQKVVLKEINMAELSSTERQMALNEVEVLSVLHHPNIISYLGSFESDGILVIEMEYADGGTLSQHLTNSKGPLTELEILSLFKQTVSAIQYMHEHNILHRDLKTVNVFLTKENIIKVGDFGISKVMNTKSQAQTVLGTPYYISPEMCEGKQYDEKSDVWALGCILYELACREKTFQGSNLPALVNKIMKGVYEPLPSIYSSGLKLLVSDILQQDPNLRPPASVIASRVSKLYEKVKQRGLTNRELNYKRSQKTRSVLYQVVGSGSTFQMSPIKLPPKAKIINIAIGNTHYIALTADMLCYTWGEGRRGQLGHDGPPDWLEEPHLLENLVSKSISMVAAGNGMSAFVTDSGMVFTCGDGTYGALGHGNFNNVVAPKLLEKLLNEDVVDISCGDNHTVCLTRDGSIYIWGMLATSQTVCIPEILPLPKNMEAESISCGPDTTGVITTSGKLFVYGSNDNNKLGLDRIHFIFHTTVARVTQLTLVSSLSKWRASKVSFGRNHTAVLTDSGQVVTMGSNNDSQLGHNSKGPALAKDMSHRIVTMVKCGPTYTLAGILENALYFWGTRFTQGKEVMDNSHISMSTIETEVVTDPQEVLILYSTEKQISENLIITLNSICALWHCLFLLVDTTATLGGGQETKIISEKEKEKQEEFDSLGPVPDWIKVELAQATHEWSGTFILSPQSTSI